MMKPSLITFITFLIIALSCPLASWGQESETEARYNLLSQQYDHVFGFDWSLDSNVIVKKNGKMGVVNVNNQLTIPLMYDSIECVGGHFIVYQNELMGMVDENNKQVIPIEFSEIEPCSDKGHSYFIVAKYASGHSGEAPPALFGLMDDCGNTKIPLAPVHMRTLDILEAISDIDGRIITSGLDDFKCGLIDFNGHVILPQEYDSIVNIATNSRFLVKKDGRYGIVDWQGNIIMPLDYDKMVLDDFYSSSLAARKAGGNTSKYAFWDYDGNQQSDEIFDDVTEYYFDMFDAYIGKRHIIIKGFYDGHAAFADMEDGLEVEELVWGYMDAHGKETVKPQFSSSKNFSEGLAAVVLAQYEDEPLYGYIDHNGKTIIPPAYSYAEDFMGGVAVVQTPELGSFVIDKQRKVVKSCSGYTSQFNLKRDKMGQVLIEEVINDDETRFYNTQGQLIKAVINGITLIPEPK